MDKKIIIYYACFFVFVYFITKKYSIERYDIYKNDMSVRWPYFINEPGSIENNIVSEKNNKQSHFLSEPISLINQDLFEKNKDKNCKKITEDRNKTNLLIKKVCSDNTNIDGSVGNPNIGLNCRDYTENKIYLDNDTISLCHIANNTDNVKL